jgi:hypothetical protein
MTSSFFISMEEGLPQPLTSPLNPPKKEKSAASLASFFTSSTSSTLSSSTETGTDSNGSTNSLDGLGENLNNHYTTSKTDEEEDDDAAIATSFIEKYILGASESIHSNKALPLQRESTRWLKWLSVLVVGQMVTILVMTELTTRVFLKLNAFTYVDAYAERIFTEPLFILLNMIVLFATITWAIISDCITLTMLWHGKQRRHLPKDKRLVHAVVITQYKEPVEVLQATIESLAESTLAHSTVVVLACEERDPNADHVFDILEEKFSHCFRDMIKTSHPLAPGEIAGCSANENYAARQVAKYAQDEGLDPYRVMLTICDADSLFDPVYLEHVEAEFWNSLKQGGERCIYNAPINTYRNLGECNLLVQACEMSRCQNDLFSGMEFRPAQSNYSLTLGFAEEIEFW